MATTDFLPSREAELVSWINTFKGLITTNYANYGLSLPLVTAYGTYATDFINAYNIAAADSTRSPSSLIAKTRAKVILLRNTRQLAGIIQEFPGTTDQMRSELGLTAPSMHTPIPPPPDAPELVILERASTSSRRPLKRAPAAA